MEAEPEFEVTNSQRASTSRDLWSLLGRMPYPAGQDASLDIYRINLRESKRIGTLTEKKRRDSKGFVMGDFDFAPTTQKGVTKSNLGQDTLLQYLTSYNNKQLKSNKPHRKQQNVTSYVPSVKELQLLDIRSYTRNPIQKQHLVARHAPSTFTHFHSRLQYSKREASRPKTFPVLTDVPHPMSYCPVLAQRSYTVQPCTYHNRPESGKTNTTSLEL